MSSNEPAAANQIAAPGVYPNPGRYRYLRYWDGSAWDPRPIAAVWTRVWCNFIDDLIALAIWIVLAALTIVPYVLLSSGATPAEQQDPLATVTSLGSLLVAFVGYFTLSYRWWGRTPGMMLGKLYVMSVREGPGKLSWTTSIVRTGGLLLGYACGLMSIIWLIVTASSRTKQGPHDSMAGTVVLSGSTSNRPPDYWRPATVGPTGAPIIPSTPTTSTDDEHGRRT